LNDIIPFARREASNGDLSCEATIHISQENITETGSTLNIRAETQSASSRPGAFPEETSIMSVIHIQQGGERSNVYADPPIDTRRGSFAQQHLTHTVTGDTDEVVPYYVDGAG
jgi:hypothetical protein